MFKLVSLWRLTKLFNLQEELEKMSQQGAGKEEQDQIVQAHQRDLQNLVNKMDADKLRMQSTLQVSLWLSNI